MDVLDTIAELSREYGGPEYVLGGGGNTSCKDESTLWIKPSGTKVKDMTRGSFVAMDRRKIGELYTIRPPKDAVEREKIVKDIMLAAVRPGSAGRPSVEAPFHDSFAARYVVHVHPAVVNGLVCAKGGEAAAAGLFPDALWIEYTDPGYTLSMLVRERLAEYVEARGKGPAVVFLDNHGVIVAGDEADAVRSAFGDLTDALAAEYEKAGVPTELGVGPAPPDGDAKRLLVEETTAMIRESVGDPDGACVTWSGPFEAPEGPVSPDHICYAKAWYLVGEPTKEAVERFRKKRGYPPRVVVCPEAVFGVGTNEDTARLALEFARDAARVRQLAAAFGGIEYLGQRSADFIDNWEVEAYRRRLAQEGKA